jgi:hypothetical protein
MSDSDTEIPTTSDEADEVCPRNVALVQHDHLDRFFHPAARVHRRRCRTCKRKYSEHVYEPAVAAPAAAAAAAGGPTTGGAAAASRYLKTLEKATDAHKALAHFTTSYRPNLNNQPQPVDVEMLFRHADALHVGFIGCPDLPEGDVPQRPTRAALLAIWKRAKAYGDVFDVIGAAYLAHLHTRPAAGNIARSELVEGGTGVMSSDEVLEAARCLQLLAIGLRSLARRDKRVWKVKYEGAPARRQVAVVGTVVWFIEYRILSLNHLRDWSKRALRVGAYGRATAPHDAAAAAADAGPAAAGGGGAVPAPLAAAAAAAGAGGGAGGAGAGAGAAAHGAAAAGARPAAMFDIAAVAREFPWVGIGEAIVARGGRVEAESTDEVWAALSAGEMVVAEAAKQVCAGREPTKPADGGGGGGGGSAGGGAGSGGGGAGTVRSREGSASPTSKRNEKRRRKEIAAAAAAAAGRGAGAGAGGAGGGGSGAATPAGSPTAGSPGRAAIEAARAVILAMPPEQLGLDECRAADLCHNCKRPYHGKNCSEALRGRKF